MLVFLNIRRDYIANERRKMLRAELNVENDPAGDVTTLSEDAVEQSRAHEGG